MGRTDLARVESLKDQHIAAAHEVEQELLLPFDYTGLDDDTGDFLRAAAERVRAKDQQARSNLIDIGSDLIKVKAKLDHGQFGAWLKAEFQWDERTAQRYMEVAEKFGDKSDIVSLLPVAATQKLAARSTPAEVRGAVVARVRAGEKFTGKAVELMVKAARASKQVARAEASLTPRGKKALAERAKQRQDEKERAQRELKHRQQERADLAAVGADLIRRQFGDRANELAHYLPVWADIGLCLQREPLASALAGAAPRTVETTDQANPSIKSADKSHDMRNQPSSEVASVLADTNVTSATAAIQQGTTPA